MSMFGKLFNAGEEELHEHWKRLEDIDQLNQIDEDSKSKPVVLFKHSTSCGISAMTKYKLEKSWDLAPEEVDFYYLDLLALRPISNHIADKYRVIHQSPQIIILKNGEVVYHTSHHMISLGIIKEHI